jgi:HAD superfamily hydrolase (TIGR01509 family)
MTWSVIAGVVFDCDGVVADSEPVIAATWTKLLSKYGYRPTLEELASAVGISFVDTHAGYARRMPDLPTASELQPEADTIYLELLPTLLHPFPDGTELARALGDRGMPVALASSSARRRLNATLRLLELQTLFSTTVAGDEVTRSKPDPEAYQRATQLLGTPPRQCLAIEDSAAGLAAAAAAGLRTVGVQRPGRILDPGSADLIVYDLRDILTDLPFGFG